MVPNSTGNSGNNSEHELGKHGQIQVDDDEWTVRWYTLEQERKSANTNRVV